jgi:hypothetical protein
MIEKEDFCARYGSREHALGIIHSEKLKDEKTFVHSGVLAMQALRNPALTDDDLFHVHEKHAHYLIRDEASKALFNRGWKRKSILDRSWVKYK